MKFLIASIIPIRLVRISDLNFRKLCNQKIFRILCTLKNKLQHLSLPFVFQAMFICKAPSCTF